MTAFLRVSFTLFLIEIQTGDVLALKELSGQGFSAKKVVP